MPNTQHSITKIVITLVILCLIIMGSVFYYRYKNQQKSTILANDHGVMFSVGRELKPLSLTANNETLTERNFRNHWTLLFFGFTHCMTVCPTTMKMLSKAYPSLHKQYPNLQVILVSLDPDRDSPTTVMKYAQRYHSAFIGATSSIQELRKLQSQLGIVAQRAETADANNYQIIHTSSIMLINPQGQWVGMFKYGMSAPEFIDAYQYVMKLIR